MSFRLMQVQQDSKKVKSASKPFVPLARISGGFFGFLFLLAGAGNAQIDSLKELVRDKRVHDSLRMKYAGDISWSLLTSDIESSLDYARLELSLAAGLNRPADIAQAYSDIGNVHNRRSVFDSALHYYQRAVELRVRLGQHEKAAGIRNNMATVYTRQSRFREALKLYFESLGFFDKAGKTEKQADCMGNIAILYDHLEQPAQALGFLRKAYALVKDKEYFLTEGNIMVTTGTIMYRLALKDSSSQKPYTLDSALAYFTGAEAKFLRANALYNVSSVYNDIGRILTHRQKHDEAVVYYQKALAIKRQFGDRLGEAISMSYLGESQIARGKIREGIAKLDSAASAFRDLHDLVHLESTYKVIANGYAAMNDYKSALRYYDLHAACLRELYSKENAEQLADAGTRYESEKKDLEIARGRAELQLGQERHYRRVAIIISVSAVVVFLLLALFALYRKRQFQQKAALDAEIARERESRARAVIEAEEKERIRIARDLHDGVGQLLSATQMRLDSLLNNTETSENIREQLHQAKAMVSDSVKEVRHVSHEMMPGTLMKLGLVSAIREFITRLRDTPGLKVNLEIVGVEAHLTHEKETAIYRAVQEIVNNVIRHAGATELTLQMIGHEKEISVVVEDNGRGFDPASIGSHSGIGLTNIISRIEFVNGRVNFDSAPGRGTTVIIEVPY